MPLYLIGERAGVGRGTLHRNFPNRQAMLTTMALHASELFARVAQPTLDDATDAREALITYLDGVVALLLAHPWIDVVVPWARAHPPEGWESCGWIEPARLLVERAKAEGCIRPDATVTDVAFIPTMIASLGSLPEPVRGLVTARARSLILDALHPDNAKRGTLADAPLDLSAFEDLVRPRRSHE